MFCERLNYYPRNTIGRELETEMGGCPKSKRIFAERFVKLQRKSNDTP